MSCTIEIDRRHSFRTPGGVQSILPFFQRDLKFSSGIGGGAFDVSQALNSIISTSNARKLVIPEERVELPLVETNPHRHSREIVLKCKPLTRLLDKPGFIGSIKSIVNRIDALGHWGIEVGPYTHELLEDGAKIRHFRGRWVEQKLPRDSSFKPVKAGDYRVCGTTRLTDAEINEKADRIIQQMRVTTILSSEYNGVYNNCQRFCKKLVSAVGKQNLQSKFSCATFFLLDAPTNELLCTTLQAATFAAMMDWKIVQQLRNPVDVTYTILMLIDWCDKAAWFLLPACLRLQKEQQYFEAFPDEYLKIFDEKPEWRWDAERLLVALMTSRVADAMDMYKAITRNTPTSSISITHSTTQSSRPRQRSKRIANLKVVMADLARKHQSLPHQRSSLFNTYPFRWP